MCGIFGIVVSRNHPEISRKKLDMLVKDLFRLSQQRGKDASGIAVIDTQHIHVLKKNIKASALVKSEPYRQLFKQVWGIQAHDNNYLGCMGHARMVTNGSQERHNNNQPVIKANRVVIHNGIIVNDKELWSKHAELKREFEVDTEIIATLLDKYEQQGHTPAASLAKLYEEIKGAASIAVMDRKSDCILLASNNGSLYAGTGKDGFIAFASEKNMLMEACVEKGLLEEANIRQIVADNFALIHLKDLQLNFLDPTVTPLPDSSCVPASAAREILDIDASEPTLPPALLSGEHLRLEKLLIDGTERARHLQRCTRCLLPETFPGIHYDKDGVCHICRNWQPIPYKGETALMELVSPYKKDSHGTYNILMPLSGGRDSCFALHYVKKVLGMNPVAYTYDWGMITDLARRNISRMTGELGIEHILISADIRKKREFIRMNVAAWLKRPSLGTVPLFMAGDKQFFYYANVLQKQFGIDLLMFGMNPLERTDFKVAFTGTKEKAKENRHYHLSTMNKLSIAMYYAKEYLLNPAYINTSLADTIGAYLSYYFIPHNYHVFYEYFPWSENIVNETIIREYGWETSPDTPTTWRIGDGTASFYNYIYLTVSGFTENDTFRSNQIRQGLITREEAYKLVVAENLPRYQSIKWYLDTIGLDFEQTIMRINSIPALY